ncbi:MAG: hypothetical protein ABW198_08870 [Pseudorhodoplanes sp.]
MTQVVTRVWRWKWLIASAALLAAIVTVALAASGKVEIWSGRAMLTIGMAPASEFIAQRSGPALEPIEPPRRAAARLSDPVFKESIFKRAAFEPATASISRSMVESSLRGIPLDKDRLVAIELSAGSASDVQSAFRAIAAEIGAIHEAILDRQLEVVKNNIDGSKAGIAAVENSVNDLNGRAGKGMSSPAMDQARLATVGSMMSAWTALQGRLRDDTALERLSEPTRLHPEADSLVVTHRSIATLRNSLLVGAAMLAAMVILTIVVSPPSRFDGE